MKVGMIGLGKLGLPVALVINQYHEVHGYDVNPDVKGYLETRSIPFREKGIEPYLQLHTIQWSDTVRSVVENSDLIFVAIQTPHAPDYEGVTRLPDTRADFDYSYLVAGLKEIADICAELKSHKTVAVISTCLPGTFRREIKPVLNGYVNYCYTPLFIAMGTVIQDYCNPEFNLLGVDSVAAAYQLKEFYKTINFAEPVITDITTAEGIKVSYNTWITAKTVIANAWGELSEKLGMDFNAIYQAWAMSTQRLLSRRYMSAGMSDGGGCHPRDNIALSWLSEQVGMSHNIWDDLMQARESYEEWHARYIADVANYSGLPLIVLGSAFKPETDITTGSPALLVANILREWDVNFLHYEDCQGLTRAVYFIATQNSRYCEINFAPGSVVIDPFGYIPDLKDVQVIRLGRR